MEPIEILLNQVEWQSVEQEESHSDDLPYATHKGVLSIAGFDFRCYQLNTGQRVIDADDMERFFNQEFGAEPPK